MAEDKPEAKTKASSSDETLQNYIKTIASFVDTVRKMQKKTVKCRRRKIIEPDHESAAEDNAETEHTSILPENETRLEVKPNKPPKEIEAKREEELGEEKIQKDGGTASGKRVCRILGERNNNLSETKVNKKATSKPAKSPNRQARDLNPKVVIERTDLSKYLNLRPHSDSDNEIVRTTRSKVYRVSLVKLPFNRIDKKPNEEYIPKPKVEEEATLEPSYKRSKRWTRYSNPQVIIERMDLSKRLNRESVLNTSPVLKKSVKKIHRGTNGRFSNKVVKKKRSSTPSTLILPEGDQNSTISEPEEVLMGYAPRTAKEVINESIEQGYNEFEIPTQAALLKPRNKYQLLSSAGEAVLKKPASCKKIILKDTPMIQSELLKRRKNAQAVQSMLSEGKIQHLYKCPEFSCHFSTDYKSVFETHLFYSHILHKEFTKDTLIPCLYCNFKTEYGTIGIHYDIRHSKSLYCCAYCFYRAENQSYVEYHQSITHERESRKVILVPHNQDSLRSSANIPIPSIKAILMPYICGQLGCQQKFIFPMDFETHLRTLHKDTFYMCFFCKFTTDIVEAITIHSQVHALYLFHCGYCEFGGISKNAIFKHLAITHYTKKPRILIRMPKSQMVSYDKDEIFNYVLIDEEEDKRFITPGAKTEILSERGPLAKSTHIFASILTKSNMHEKQYFSIDNESSIEDEQSSGIVNMFLPKIKVEENYEDEAMGPLQLEPDEAEVTSNFPTSNEDETTFVKTEYEILTQSKK